MVTIKDIAKEAGVSVTTVSNVIHKKKSRVSQELVERIDSIIKKYHYSPNLSARTLVSKSSRIICILIYGEHTDARFISEDPFLGMLVRAIELEISLRGYFAMIRTVCTEEELLTLRDNWNLAGVVVYGLFEGDFLKLLSNADIPCVLIDSYIKNDSFYRVGINDYEGALMAVKYLISMGHKNIAFVSPTIFDEGVVRERFKGYTDALKKAHIKVNEKNVFQVSTLEAGPSVGKKIAERKDITAVFATADFLALGVISGLKEKGVSVPEDKSVVGFDDLFCSPIFNPPLTTIHQDVKQKGFMAVDNLIRLIEGKEVKINDELPISLVERGSVKKL